MNVYSLKTMKQRLVTVIPRSDWIEPHDQQQNEEHNNSTSDDLEKLKQSKSAMHLGCSIRYESVKNALNCVWHVIGVKPDSPAERASISSDGTDYIVGYDNRLFSEPNELTELLSHYQGISASSIYLSLFVYNWKTDSFRHVVVNMSDGGHLGIELGTGYLHIIPPPSQFMETQSEHHNMLNGGEIALEKLSDPIDSEYVFVNHLNSSHDMKQQEITQINQSIRNNKEEIVSVTNVVEIKEISTPPINSQTYSIVSNEETNELSKKTQTLDINIGFFNPTTSSALYSDEPSLGEIIGEEGN
ncbi:hypothetical protein NAEGRDRAFT_62049 [Naegleria gruberi]|uniref:Uncharacterized protein AM21 n=1 Tax=Naegleria gruberi TaxID=5762 RepID=D2UZT0_NAEGR|nr:uncharacterized protein NAEGRDRAFT_62049 [Naegleria gruberi]EFC50216.1 hypothetical protein NAEGRDRAFT_62049 [Naegleria gruberi]|eukprot:XP_002682960.1 hypothetical protein NAEGRDRAFT_62049 [Naegleria gruberi strain NEG-M]